VIDLVEAGRPVAVVAAELGISGQSIYMWRRQARIDAGVEPGLTTAEHAELVALRKRVRELETELVLGRGIAVCRQTVETLMRRAGLGGVSGRPKFRKVPNVAAAADLVGRDFARAEPDRLWVTDITEHPTRDGKGLLRCGAGHLQPPRRGLDPSIRGPPRRWSPMPWAWRSRAATPPPTRP